MSQLKRERDNQRFLDSHSRRLLSTAQAADYLGVSVNTIRNYIAQGWISAIRVGPKLLRFDPVDLDAAAHRIGE
jgi:excisionase family DNA binding protein